MKILILLTLLLFSCKKEKMFNLETIDSKRPYKIKTISKVLENANYAGAFPTIEIRSRVNMDSTTIPGSSEIFWIDFNVSKKIIPLYLSLSVSDFAFPIVNRIKWRTPFYRMATPTGLDITKYLVVQNYIIPYTFPVDPPVSENIGTWEFYYNDLLFNEDDFIDVSSGAEIYWVNDPNKIYNPTSTNIPMPAGNYFITNVLTYLELQ